MPRCLRRLLDRIGCIIQDRYSWQFALPLSVLLILSFPIVFPGPASAAGLTLIDAHSQIDNGVDMNQAVSLMDEAGIAHAILSSLRGAKKAPEIIDAAKRHPGRITPSIGLKGEAFRAGDLAALATVRPAGELPVFGAMSEVMILHQQKGKVAPEIAIGFDAPQVHEALSIALKRRWPLVMHIEFGFARARNDYERYMKGLETFLDAHADHPLALTHMGQLSPAEVGRLIEGHRNIYFLTSHANTVWIHTKGHGLPWSDLFDDKKIASEWLTVMLRHPDRFVLAFDNVLDEDWSGDYVTQVRLWQAALVELPISVAHAVAQANAERLWRLRSAHQQIDSPQTASALQSEIVGPKGLTARQILMQSDKDGDGRLNRTEFRRPPQVFNFVDANHDGYVTAAELEAAWRKMRRNPRASNIPGISHGQKE
jgi:hypothetical protein